MQTQPTTAEPMDWYQLLCMCACWLMLLSLVPLIFTGSPRYTIAAGLFGAFTFALGFVIKAPKA